MAATGEQQGAAPPTPPAATAAQPNPPTASQQLYAEQVRRSMDQLRALFAQLDAAGGGDPPPGFFEPCRGQPGVRLDPVTWAELSALLADGSEQALGTLGRTPLQIKEYWDYRDTVVLKRFASVTDYLRQKVFGLPTAPGPDGRMVAQVPPGFFWSNGSSGGSDGGSSRSGGGSGGGGGENSASSCCSCPDAGSNGSNGSSSGHQLVTVWRDNDFPYHLAPGITHFNLWANRPLSQREIEQHIEQHVPPGVETLWFVNPPVLQSVPAIWHAHILVQQGTMAANNVRQTAAGAAAANDVQQTAAGAAAANDVQLTAAGAAAANDVQLTAAGAAAANNVQLTAAGAAGDNDGRQPPAQDCGGQPL